MTESSNQITTSDADQIASLIAALASDDCTQRQRARESLVKCGQPAVASLIEALHNPKTQVRWEAAKSFVELPDASAVPALIATLADDDPGVRWTAGEALIELGDAAVVPLLKAVIENTTRLREGTHHVLHHLAHCNDEYCQHLHPVVKALQTLEPEIAAPVAAEAALNALATR